MVKSCLCFFLLYYNIAQPSCPALKHGIGADLICFSCYIYATGELCHKGSLHRVMQKGIVRSCLSEIFKQLTWPDLEIWYLVCSQNGHL